MKTELPKIVVIVGPTASGKSALGVLLAKKFGGEIVSADSRQVYRGMNIGTGKVTKKEMAGIPHWLIDVASPKRTFTVAEYLKLAQRAISDIHQRGKLPILVGGTGFYIDALIKGLSIPPVPPNPKLRSRLERKSIAELFHLLKKKDPRRAKTIDPKNKRRIVRALEIVYAIGKVPPLESAPKYDALFIGIRKPPERLRRLIRERLLKRVKLGMIAEVKRLHDKRKISWKRLENFGLEYRYIAFYLQGKLSREETLRQLELAIWHYAKRQITWFKKNKKIRWIKNENEALELAKNFLPLRLPLQQKIPIRSYSF